MNIPPKYEDVVAKLDEALGREAAGNNIIAGQRTSLDVCAQQINALQQRLTVAEKRGGELEGMLRHFALCADVRSVGAAAMSFVAALKPAEEGEGS